MLPNSERVMGKRLEVLPNSETGRKNGATLRTMVHTINGENGHLSAQSASHTGRTGTSLRRVSLNLRENVDNSAQRPPYLRENVDNSAQRPP